MVRLTAKEFLERWTKSGAKMSSKGRPIMPDLQEDGMSFPKSESAEESLTHPQPNKKVRNAKKHYDETGKLIAHSTWELQCLRMLQMVGLEPEQQRAFEILSKVRGRGLKRSLGKRTWSPDFTFDDLKIVADAKGWTTEMARIKIHLFLEKYNEWEVYILKTEKDVYDLIEIIKERREK